MRNKFALPLTVLLGGAAGFLLRRWELASAFEADTGLPVSGAALWVSEALTPVEREAEIYLPDAGIGEPNAEIRVKAPLSAGDRVLLYSDDDQVFYILVKVVSAS